MQQTSCMSYGDTCLCICECVCVVAGIWNLTMRWLEGQAQGTASRPGGAACTTTIHINRIRQLIINPLWYRLMRLGRPGAGWLRCMLGNCDDAGVKCQMVSNETTVGLHTVCIGRSCQSQTFYVVVISASAKLSNHLTNQMSALLVSCSFFIYCDFIRLEPGSLV